MSAEPAVATSAPEHDAQEDAPNNPTLSEHCTTDRPTPAGEAPKGEVRKLGGVDVYLAKPDSYPSDPCKLLLLLTGGTGLQSQNNQIQADKFATEGFVVIMPDLFEGDPAPNQSAKLPEPGNVEGQTQDEIAGSFLEQFKAKIGETAKSFLIDMWLARHTEEKVMPILEKVIQAAQGEFADAIGHGGGIYGVGYCFGGRYILLLASERAANQTGWTGAQKPADEEAGDNKSGPLIKAGALAHATLVSQEDFNSLKSPISLVCVENDPMFPDEVRTLGEDTMNKTGVEHEVQVYPGVPHGFAVYGDYEEAHIKEAQSTAHEQMLKWILEH